MSTYKMKGRAKLPKLPKTAECGFCGELVPIAKWLKFGISEYPGHAMVSNAQCSCGQEVINVCVFGGFPFEVAQDIMISYIQDTGGELVAQSVFNDRGERYVLRG